MDKTLNVNKENASTAIKERENMVRKAETLNSINELKLSGRTQRQVEKRFGSDVGSVIEAGRRVALGIDMRPELMDEEPKYMQELVKALDEAGFVRHDLCPRTWCIWNLYVRVTASSNSSMVNSVVISLLSNEGYESMQTISDEDFEKVGTVLDSLTERERTVLILRFGLDCGTLRGLETVGRMFGVTRERIRQIESKAFRKLRHPSRLAKLPALFGFVPPAEPEPRVRFSADGTNVIDTDADIRDLELSARAYYCLKRNRINTVGDILSYPKEDWPKVRNLSRKTTLEIQEKMRTSGYPDFSVGILS